MKTALKTNDTSVRLQERADVLARTVMSQQAFYQTDQCSPNQRQLLETRVGAAIWYFPQSDEHWTGLISVDALKAFVGTAGSKAVKLTKDHRYPRKVAAAELFSLKWTTISDPAEEVLRRYLDCYGQFNLVLPEENKRLVKHQKTQSFVSPADAYAKAGIELKPLSRPLLKAQGMFKQRRPATSMKRCCWSVWRLRAKTSTAKEPVDPEGPPQKSDYANTLAAMRKWKSSPCWLNSSLVSPINWLMACREP